SAGQFHAAKLILAVGPWSTEFLREIGIKVEVYRKDVYWYPVDDACMRADHGCPAYLYERDARHLMGVWYGIPEVDDWGFKIAEHTNAPYNFPIQDPLSARREIRDGWRQETEAVLSALLPWVGRPLLHHSVCFYTMSPDENFIVDLHPRHPQVA